MIVTYYQDFISSSFSHFHRQRPVYIEGAGILSAVAYNKMATVSISAPGLSSGLLYNNGNNNARICITSETGEFDNQTIQDWQDEGFDVVYLPLNGGGKQYESQLKSVKEGLGVGENYAVIGMHCLLFSITKDLTKSVE